MQGSPQKGFTGFRPGIVVEEQDNSLSVDHDEGIRGVDDQVVIPVDLEVMGRGGFSGHLAQLYIAAGMALSMVIWRTNTGEGMYPSPLHREMETSGSGIPIHQLARTYDELTVVYVNK